MESKDLLSAEIQLFGSICFLFISACAGFGYIISLAGFQDNTLLLTLFIITTFFIIVCALWGFATLIKIQKLKKNNKMTIVYIMVFLVAATLLYGVARVVIAYNQP